MQVKRTKNKIVKTGSIFNRYKDELKKINEIPMPENCIPILAHYTDKQPGSRTSTLNFYEIYSDHLEKIDIR